MPIALPPEISPAVLTELMPWLEEAGGTGGGTWSKKPPFSS